MIFNLKTIQMKHTKYFFILTLLFVSCGATKNVASPIIEAKQTFTFDYASKEAAKLGSASMVLAFIKPDYVKDFSAASNELFIRFKNGLTGDVDELIISKGFSLKGPFDGIGEMIFEDKKRTDLAISIEISPAFASQVGSWTTKYHANLLSLLGNSYYGYTYSGTTSLTGKVNINGIEPLTGERIWTKSVAIPNIENIPINTTKEYGRELTFTELLEDPGVYNALGKALQAQYNGIMDKVAAHFNVEELSSLKNQIKELKSKKAF